MAAVIECRPLNASDIPLIIDLARRTWPTAYADVLSTEQIDNILMRIYCEENLRREMAEGHRFWVADVDGIAMGFASGYREGAAVWLKKLYVLPQYQGRGVGRVLMTAVVEAFSPVEEIRLLVNSGNRSAQAFYARCGFSKAGEVPVQMGDYRFTDFVFCKPIRPRSS